MPSNKNNNRKIVLNSRPVGAPTCQPQAGETVVVAAASGAVGSVVVRSPRSFDPHAAHQTDQDAGVHHL